MATAQSVTDVSGEEVRRRVRVAMVASGIAGKINGRSTELTENSEVVLRRRYLSKDREGNILEDPDGMFRRVARNLSMAELNYPPVTEVDRQAVEDEFYGVMRRLEFMPNSPTLMNAGGNCSSFPPASCCPWAIPWTPFLSGSRKRR